MGWEKQAEFVSALKKAKCGSEKKIHKVAQLALQNKGRYKHVVKSVQEFFRKGFRPGDSRITVAYIVDAIIKADAKSKRQCYARRFEPWLTILYDGCGVLEKDHQNLKQLRDLWGKFFKAEILASLDVALTKALARAKAEEQNMMATAHKNGLKNLESIIADDANIKRKAEFDHGVGEKKRRLNNSVAAPIPQVRVQTMRSDPRGLHTTTPAVAHSGLPVVDPRLRATPQQAPPPPPIPTPNPTPPTNAFSQYPPPQTQLNQQVGPGYPPQGPGYPPQNFNTGPPQPYVQPPPPGPPQRRNDFRQDFRPNRFSNRARPGRFNSHRRQRPRDFSPHRDKPAFAGPRRDGSRFRGSGRGRRQHRRRSY